GGGLERKSQSTDLCAKPSADVPDCGLSAGRSGEIRTPDPLLPKQASPDKALRTARQICKIALALLPTKSLISLAGAARFELATRLPQSGCARQAFACRVAALRFLVRLRYVASPTLHQQSSFF